MKARTIQMIALAGVALTAGYALRGSGSSHVQATSRVPLYYVDPMHPDYKSSKPGTAPDCGMQLEPVFGDAKAVERSNPQTVHITPDQQSLIGLRTITVSRSAGGRTLRTVGRVAAEDGRIHSVTALADGVIRSVSSREPGSRVRQDEVLATYFVYLRDMYNAIQSYFVAMSALDQRSELLAGGPGAADTTKAEIRKQEELLKAYGITEAQIREIARTREITRDIQFRSPVTGVILSRNAYLGQKVDRGTELFRLADLSTVWIIADIFDGDSVSLQPGTAAEVRCQGRTLKSTLADVRQVDPASRTIKVRLEVSNPDLFLRPDMFVDVDFNLSGSDQITVPVDAVMNTGRHKTVFLSANEGSFEPREITTGNRYGDRVEVLNGLREGDRVVASGLFLLDSESRLQLARPTGETNGD